MYQWPMLGLQPVQTFFSAITFALTLLLVFKTNSSYARWWEARKDVGQLVSLAHNIVRQASGCESVTAGCRTLVYISKCAYVYGLPADQVAQQAWARGAYWAVGIEVSIEGVEVRISTSCPPPPSWFELRTQV